RAPLYIVAGAVPRLLETGAGVKFARRYVILLDLEEHGARAESREAAQVQIKQPARQAPSARAARDSDRENLGLGRGPSRQDETEHSAAAGPPVGEDAAIGQQLLEFLLAPAAIERGGVNRRACGGIARRGRPKRRLRAAEPGEQARHRRGSRPASCGRASGR